MSLSLSFPDNTYTTSNKPTTGTLKSDLQAIETDHNAHIADTTIHMTIATIMGVVYPVGSVFTSVVSTDPSTLLGFGTWARIAEGQMLVGYKSGDSDFGTVEGTGGAKTSSALIAHTHTGTSHTHTGTSDNGGVDHSHTYSGNTGDQSADHNHTVGNLWINSATFTDEVGSANTNAKTGTATSSGVSNGHTHAYSGTTSGASAYNHTHTFTTGASGTGNTGSAGSGSSFSILNPYFVIYAWKRTA